MVSVGTSSGHPCFAVRPAVRSVVFAVVGLAALSHCEEKTAGNHVTDVAPKSNWGGLGGDLLNAASATPAPRKEHFVPGWKQAAVMFQSDEQGLMNATSLWAKCDEARRVAQMDTEESLNSVFSLQECMIALRHYAAMTRRQGDVSKAANDRYAHNLIATGSLLQQAQSLLGKLQAEQQEHYRRFQAFKAEQLGRDNNQDQELDQVEQELNEAEENRASSMASVKSEARARAAGLRGSLEGEGRGSAERHRGTSTARRARAQRRVRRSSPQGWRLHRRPRRKELELQEEYRHRFPTQDGPQRRGPSQGGGRRGRRRPGFRAGEEEADLVAPSLGMPLERRRRDTLLQGQQRVAQRGPMRAQGAQAATGYSIAGLLPDEDRDSTPLPLSSAEANAVGSFEAL